MVRHPRVSPIGVVFGCTIFASSALLFLVQPMFARMALPMLGGSPSVWNTCVVFFQAALLCGYGYAHLVSRLALPVQVAIHAVLSAIAIGTLPIAIPAEWQPPADGAPVIWLLGLLAARVAVPFVVASAAGPLLQRWFSLGRPAGSSDPYLLYATSNLGSLASLLAYPFIVEPRWPLPVQSRLWAWSFAAVGAGIILCGVLSWRSRRAGEASAVSARVEAQTDRGRISWRQRVHWLALAAVPSSLMLSVTTYLSTDIASVPLLWILPLTGYLLSFVLAFGPWSTWGRSLPGKLAPPLICALAIFLVQNAGLPLILSIALHLAAFFAIAAALHIELANRRPHVRHLTEFYFWLSAGGVVGGSFTAIVAPAAFNTVAEYPIALIVACLLLPPPEDTPARAPAMATPVLIGLLVWAGVAWSTAVDLDPRLRIALLMPLSVWTLSISRHRLPFTLALACWFVAGEAARDRAGRLVQQRSFFGVYLVEAARGSHRLWHGTTLHGEQRVDARPPVPLTYYHPTGPIGQAVTAILGDRPSARVAAVGLGAGSLAAYVRENQEWTFYEIDPLVEDIARNPALFGYLEGCGDRCRVVLGDARLSLARATGERFDLIVLDAFSSDAIPVHLMTREALDLYLSRLAPDGVLAFHISNRHLALGPVLGALFADRGLVGLAQLHVVATPDPEGRSTSEWLVAARHAGELRSLSFDARWTPTRAEPGSRVWTDQFSDVVSVLRGFP